MKTKSFSIFTILLTLVIGLTSCFLDLRPDKFNVTYNYNYVEEGKSLPTESVYLVLEGSSAPAMYIQREGYTFDGWCTDSACTKPFDFTVEIKDDITLYAKWLGSYTVTFDYNYIGSPVAYEATVVENKAVSNFPATRIGYALGGWYTVSDKNLQNESTKVDFTSPITKDVVYFAKWIDAVKISFNYNDGAVPTIEEQYIQKNTSAVAITPSREGYSFAGWYTSDKVQTEDFKVNFANQISEDKIFYAKWTSNWEVIFDYNYEGSPAPYIKEVADKGTVNSLAANWSGHALVGWYTSPNPGESDSPVSFPVTIEENVKYYAKWTSNTVKVSYDYGYDNKVEDRYIAYNTSAEDLKPTREGYEFDKWYVKGTTNPVVFDRLVENQNYYAKWLKYYEVTFDYNFDDAPEAHKETVLEGSVTTSYPAARTNYALEGWYTKDDVKVEDFSTFIINEDTTLYAKWTNNVYSVTYNYNIGTDPTVEQSYILKGTTAVNKEPKLTGYVFDGWYKEKELENEEKFETPLESDQTYYAKWLKIFKITFNYNYSGSPIVYETYVTENDTVQSHQASRAGYALDGWYTVSGTTEGTEVDFNDEIKEDKIYYAKWTENVVKVTFNYNYGINPITEEKYVVKNTTVDSVVATRDGYVFDGWYTQGDKDLQNEDTKADFSVQLTSSKTYFAKWLKKCKVSFDYNYEGSPVPYETYVLEGEKATSYPATRLGYGLAGWYTVSNKNQQATTAEEVLEGKKPKVDFNETINKDVTYYARWSEDVVEVTYDLNYKKGTNAETEKEVRRIANSTNADLFVPEREGDWKFEGWYTSATNQTAGNKITTPPTVQSGETYIYYAKWTQIFTVQFNLQDDDTDPTIYEVKVEDGKKVSKYQATRNGWALEGWYTANEDEVDFEDGITEDKIYYAKWSQNSVKVTFYHGYDSKKTEKLLFKGLSGALVETYEPTRTGYTFKGWYSSNEVQDNNTKVSLPKTVTVDTNYYAKWEANSYHINCFDQGGTLLHADDWDMNQPATHTYGMSTTLATPIRTGYTFEGWYVDIGCTTSAVGVLGATDYTKDINLYAKWEGKQYTVTFVNETEDATTPSPKTKTVTYGSAYGTLATTKLDGWEFDWYDAKEDGHLIDASTIVETASNHTLYAIGVHTILDVTYDYNHDGLKKTSKYARNTTLFEETPSRAGYIFDGWYTDKDTQDSTTKVDFEKKIDKNQTIYAKWLKNCKVTFNFGVGSYSTYVVEGNTISAFDATRTGYSLENWYTSDTTQDNTTKVDFSSEIESDVTYYAKWTTAKYAVSFNANNGTNLSATSIDETYGAYYSLPSITAPAGYTFKGWYTALVGGTEVTTSTVVGTTANNQTLYAQWNPITYTITYYEKDKDNNAIAFTGTPERKMPVTHTYGQETSLVLHTTKTGYTFGGWYTDKACSNVNRVTELDATTYTANIVLYAKWTPNTYKITYLDKGDISLSATSWESGTLYYKHTYGTDTSLLLPIKTGHDFGGWYIDSGCNTLADYDSENKKYYIDADTTEDIMLYAKWTPQSYEITYMNDSTNEYAGDFVNTAPEQHTYGSDTTLINASNSDTAAFIGWYTDKDCTATNKVTSLGKTDYTGDITLYAKWAPYYNIVYKTVETDGDGKNPFVEVYENASTIIVNCPKVHTYGFDTSLAAPTRPGYIFDGWYEEVTPIYDNEEKLIRYDYTGARVSTLGGITYKSDIVLYAKWTPITYIVIFDDNGKTNDATMAEESFAYDATKPLPENTYKKTGYHFTGWALTKNGSVVYTDKRIISKNNDNNITTVSNARVTLYAVWEANTYYIRFNKNDNNITPVSGLMENQKLTYDADPTAISANLFTRDHYTLVGWSKSADTSPTDTGNLYSVTSLVQNLTTEKDKVVDFYAIWQPETYSITYCYRTALRGSNFTPHYESNWPTTHTYGSTTTLPTPVNNNVISFSSNIYGSPYFDGWYIYDDYNAGHVTELSATGYTGNITLYAQWKYPFFVNGIKMFVSDKSVPWSNYGGGFYNYLNTGNVGYDVKRVFYQMDANSEKIYPNYYNDLIFAGFQYGTE